ncbi:Cof-type HAD-IIB family hydrolase [Euryarchaeota archaeon]|jgi:HAD superfamily hydrolase (TIGR01484 family)|nr:Cof-type HAD-IIB family hydrolase [Euryarchaeota archaeon]
MKPLIDMSTEESRNIKAILFDLDGTFVNSDELKSQAYSSLESIREKGLKTVAVTGRPAGWCDLIARWWPVDAVVGENGAFFFYKNKDKIIRKTFYDLDMQYNNRRRLDELFEKCLLNFPYIKMASDQSFRQWDLAIDIAEETQVSTKEIVDIVNFAEGEGACTAISNIHINIWFGDYNKEQMSLKVLKELGLSSKNILYVGDSPNDSPMFKYFESTVGVKSVMNYEGLIDTYPKYITTNDEGDGFVELINFLISTR